MEEVHKASCGGGTQRFRDLSEGATLSTATCSPPWELFRLPFRVLYFIVQARSVKSLTIGD